MQTAKLKEIGRFETNVFDEGAAEIVAHDPGSQRLFVVNGDSKAIDVLDISDPTNPTFLFAIDIDATVPDGTPNSVATGGGIVAVAVEADTSTDPGSVIFYDTSGAVLNTVAVGVQPDMLTFTPDGNTVLVANEGEPDNGVDPEGSISIIDISGGVAAASVATADFTAFNGQEDALRALGVRIFSGNDAANDVEPEFIAVSPDGTEAFVTLQEANAFAVVDIATETVTAILPLGTKDHSKIANRLDASDEDGGINIQKWPVFGMFMPDAIASFETGGNTYYITGNEGDARNEDERIGNLTLDPTAFPNAAFLQQQENLGRLEVSTIDGDLGGDGDFDQLFAYGARSFTIWDDAGNLVFDSGDEFEQITALAFPANFNANNDDNDIDGRSDNKGPEPEGVAVGEVNGRIYAFIGLERIGGIMVYDVTDPANAEFVHYVNPRDFAVDPETGTENGTVGDLGPEGLAFISAADSPNGVALLAVGNEVSGTTTLFQIDLELTGAAGTDILTGLMGDDLIRGSTAKTSLRAVGVKTPFSAATKTT